jgi:hypothetical protein
MPRSASPKTRDAAQPPAQASALEGLDRRVQRGGEHARDEDPREHPPRVVDEQQSKADEDDDPERLQDRPRTHDHDANLGSRHGR